MSRKRLRAVQGAILGVLAAPGWAALQCLIAPHRSLTAEILASPVLYAYLLVGAAGGFALFGATVGHAEDALLDDNHRLDTLAVSDPLTGLKNVRYFRARLVEARAAAVRSGEPLTLIVLDLDGFKQINDQFGHPVGDALLSRVADAVAAAVREGDTAARVPGSVARVGGEEFAVLLPGADEQDALGVAGRITDAVRNTWVLAGRSTVRVTASAGVAALEPALSPDALYARADEAMYASKRAGRDRATVWRGPGDGSRSGGDDKSLAVTAAEAT